MKEKIENLEPFSSIEIEFNNLKYKIKNENGHLKIEIKPLFIYKIIAGVIILFPAIIIAILLTSIITDGQYVFKGFGAIPFVILMFFTDSLAIFLTKKYNLKEIKNFTNEIDNFQIKSIYLENKKTENTKNKNNYNIDNFLLNFINYTLMILFIICYLLAIYFLILKRLFY